MNATQQFTAGDMVTNTRTLKVYVFCYYNANGPADMLTVNRYVRGKKQMKSYRFPVSEMRLARPDEIQSA